ncbi:hypothetical protein D3874_23660 [Oleomonas cavernae]|uniref:Uncharacterized protein n=2 Tax=Oleomonas cavernae TaxID=2320859 RepID=A0A418WHS9_9PROT|nr:hypothetical protein D3874_23660 [Oleomonas cavernae]
MMPFAHAGGAALALICAPLGIAALSPALIAGRGFTGTLLLGLFPLGALTAAYGALAAIYGGDPTQPFAGLLGSAGIDPALGLTWVALAPVTVPLLWRAVTMPSPDRLILAGLLAAPALAALLHGLGGGTVTPGQIAGPAAVVAGLAHHRSPTLLVLSWGLLLLAGSSPGTAPC